MGSKKKKKLKYKQENEKIGVTVVSEALTSDIDNFWFALEKDSLVAPFDFVSVKGTKGKMVIGIVDDLRVVPSKKGSNDEDQRAVNHAADSSEGDHILQNEKGIMVAKAAILANTNSTSKESPHSANLPVMPVMPGRKVQFADTEEVLFALGIPEMQNPIPAGVIKMTNGLMVPVSLDVSYIAGPDTAHVNAAGISGNRKTSYLLFLLHSAYQRLSKHGVSLIIFNTKEAELLQVDVERERERELSKEDVKFYNLMGLEMRPFSNVTYFLPRGSDGKPNSSIVPKNSKTYSYELEDIYDRLELLFSHTADPMYDGLISIVNYIGESWPIKGNSKVVTSWTDLASFTDYPDEVVPHKSTLVHFLGYLKKFNKSNLFVEKRKRSVILEEEIKRIKAGDTYVIDLAKLPTLEEQSLVVGDVMRTVDEMYSARNTASLSRSGGTKAKYLLIFIDEINRFLPSSVAGTKRMSATAEQITRTVIAGKSRDTVLLSAQQFKSSVDNTLHDNTGTHMFAKLGFTELSKPSYQMIKDSMKGNIVRLNKGDIIMTHPAFRHPIKISFPHVSFKRS
jgi:DNA helicase HerA-like ATPase